MKTKLLALVSLSAAFGLALSLDAAPVPPVPADPDNAFRVTPYVQRPSPTAMSLLWLAQTNGTATLAYWPTNGPASTTVLSATARPALSDDVSGQRFSNDNALEYCLAPELGYDRSAIAGDNEKVRFSDWAMDFSTPWQYRARLTGLRPDTVYAYRVELAGGVAYTNAFRTPPSRDPSTWNDLKFIYYSDSETEPRDNLEEKVPGAGYTGYTPDWTDPETQKSRTYYVTQTVAYKKNIETARAFGAELIVMAGDLAQKGSKQVDWDEFWRHNAGPLNDPAGSVPVLASPGNHDYWDYRDGGECALKKYMSYFEYEPNDAGVDRDQQERFHRVDYGPATFLFLDGNNGDDSDPSKDTNHNFSRAVEGCRAPDFNEGSRQYQWLERQLQDAHGKSAFIFIVTHQCPFSVGYHGRDTATDTLSGRPLRVWLPLLHKYGVTAWLAGHDEMMEHSTHTEMVERPDGTTVPHTVHVWDMGIAGDGLRGDRFSDNTNEVWRADVDCPEVWENGRLVSGGKHYGHMEVSVSKLPSGAWEAKFEPVYLFANMNPDGTFAGTFERCVYDDVTTVTNAMVTPVDPVAYDVGPDPKSVLVSFADGPDTRGFAWETDTSVAESKLWIVEGASASGAAFDAVTPVEGTSVDRTQSGKTVRCHKARVTGLVAGRTYSYRVGSADRCVRGQFTVEDVAGRAVKLLTFSDAQVKYTPSFPVWANTVARATAVVDPADVDAILFGGDMFDTYSSSISAYNYLKWGAAVDSATPYFPGVAWSLSSGNHDLDKGDYQYYRELTGVNYSTEQCHAYDYGAAHIVVLPFVTGENAANFTQVAAWADADLKAANAAGRTTWNVVMMHWGPYTTGDHGCSSATTKLVELFCPIFSSNHVDLVLQAHDHCYSKTLPYRWDTCGYTTSRDDATIVNVAPKTTTIGGATYDLNPQGTYYVSAGCSGPRVYEGNGEYAFIGGAESYTGRTYKVATGKIALDSAYGRAGDDGSSELREAMFGILRADARTLTYDWYAVATNGLSEAVHYDTLKIIKKSQSSAGLLFRVK